MHPVRSLHAAALGVVLTSACSDPPDPPAQPESSTSTGSETTTSVGPETTTGLDSASTTSTTSSTTTDGTTSTPVEDSSGSPPVLDVNQIPDIGVMRSCTKIDFLFVIDNSGSMADEQENLTSSFPAFISGIQSSLEQVDDYHVGVVTTDAYAFNTPGCDVLGGLVTQTGGFDSSDSVCGPYAAGFNFMTEQDALDVVFACAADTGTAGNGIERPMDALVNVVTEVHGGVGGCNEGFLRDDALLVVVIITDEYDGPGDPEGTGSMGDAMTWYDTVVAAKLGHPENVVALGLLSYAGGPCPPASVVFDGVHMVDFVQSFGVNGILGGVCEPDYGPVFASATGIIEDACNAFVP